MAVNQFGFRVKARQSTENNDLRTAHSGKPKVGPSGVNCIKGVGEMVRQWNMWFEPETNHCHILRQRPMAGLAQIS